MIKYLFPILALAPTLAFADLGDTLQSSQAKYGDPVTGIGNPHEVIYNYNGYRIRQTYNDNGICVVAEFARLDGKPISNKVGRHLDSANLPPMILNAQANGWLYQNWKDNSNFRHTVSWMWNNGITFFQVVSGQFRLGNETQWHWSREYFTPEGVAIIKADNAVNAANSAEPAVESDPTKTNI